MRQPPLDIDVGRQSYVRLSDGREMTRFAQCRVPPIGKPLQAAYFPRFGFRRREAAAHRLDVDPPGAAVCYALKAQ